MTTSNLRHLSITKGGFFILKYMEPNTNITPMTGPKVSYNIRHDDLMDFADRIIRKVKEEERKHQQEAADSGLLTRAEVKELFHVCDSTITKWAAKKYLVPVRVGGKTMFRKEDVRRIIEKRR